ncbi:MAG: hypothetical protein IJD98_04850 [Oscillospiraceae bacterium]|nr:hypothetical protein [Oscillospiraceae bacterium]
MKKKVIGLLIVLAMLIGAALYASWAHTPVLELFPDGEWEGAVYQRFMEEDKQEISHEQLRQILEEQDVWYSGGLGFLPEYSIAVTIDGQRWLLGVSEGYTAVISAGGETNASQYRDDGTVYRLVKEYLLSQ